MSSHEADPTTQPDRSIGYEISFSELSTAREVPEELPVEELPRLDEIYARLDEIDTDSNKNTNKPGRLAAIAGQLVVLAWLGANSEAKKADVTTESHYYARARGLIESVTHRHKFSRRDVRAEDIPELVDIDIEAFGSVYRDYDVDPEAWKEELTDKFQQRYEKLGGKWMYLVERDGQPCGFIVGCPTSKTPDEFKSWEDTTDNGTLETTFDPNGDYVYVVSLSMLPVGSSQKGQNMLLGKGMGRFIQEGHSQVFFESRLPGLKAWVTKQCQQLGTDIEALTDAEKDQLANEYFGLKKVVNGKQVPYDRLIEIYSRAGCKFLKVVPNAYRDSPSMNYGVVCVRKNPVPEWVKKIPGLQKTLGKTVEFASRSHWLMKKVF